MSDEQRLKKVSNQDHIELEWASKIHNGDIRSFEKLVNHYSEPLYHFTLNFIKNYSVAEDIIQDVFVGIWQKRNNWYITSRVKTYLFRAVRNKILNYLKHLAIEESSTENLTIFYKPTLTPEELLIKKEDIHAINEAVEQLPGQCRLIFKMKIYDDLTYSEIAEILDVSVNTVQTHMGLAFKHLRKYLTRKLSDPVL